MENKQSIQYTYSASQKSQVEQIRSKYLPQEESGLQRLQRLDAIPENGPAHGPLPWECWVHCCWVAV